MDATIVPVPKQRNSREENETVKRGETPAEWEQKPAKNRQKDKDARWTKKHGKSFFGYKNHVNVDRRHKLIRDYAVTGPPDTVDLAGENLPGYRSSETSTGCPSSTYLGHLDLFRFRVLR